MNLSCATTWPEQMPEHLRGKPTRFREKILNSLSVAHAVIDSLTNLKPGEFEMKPHTIRADKNKRWKPGMVIHFFEWTGKPYRSSHYKFAPKVICVSVQEIEIVWTDPDGFRMTRPTIWVDKKWMVGAAEEQLAINDGFDSLDSFYAWFNKDFSGRIIHWTDLKY